jgi:serine/threonine-protein kinase
MGYYRIGPKIGSGGMAEVYLGLHEAIGGFQKLVVMKRLSGCQSRDREAVDRLLAEARLAASINHPNIVSTLDIGSDGAAPYLVLEYLSGEDLRHILSHLRRRGDAIPPSIACRIGASIAAALHQAHELILPDGTVQCVVHRDVTPSNIVVCFSGVTKLVDFGVARVTSDERKTQAGTIKGKFSYLAPEQLSGGELDARTDVFQLGIVLWEMLTNQRLFDGRSDYERVNAVLSRPIPPPSQLNPALPPSFDPMVLRALDRNPDGRYGSAHELEVELQIALTALGDTGGDQTVAEWMQSAFSKRQRWRRELERRTLLELSDDSDCELELKAIEGSVVVSGADFTRPESALPPATLSGHGSAGSLAPVTIERTATSLAAATHSATRFLALGLGIAAGVGLLLWFQGQRPAAANLVEGAPHVAVAPAPAGPEPIGRYLVEIDVSPSHALIAVDDQEVGSGRYTGTFADDGAPHVVTVQAPGFNTARRSFRGAVTIALQLEEQRVAGGGELDDPGDDTATAAAAARPKARRRAARPAPPRAAASPDSGASREPRARPDASPPPATRPAPRRDFEPTTDNLDPFQ